MAATRGFALLFRGISGLCAALALAVLLAPTPAPAVVFNPKTFTLANGLQVVVVENHRAPIVSQMVWYKVGSADEQPGKSGLAHFLEHLMFKGTPSVPPGEFSRIVARNGGDENAFTTRDYTAYFQRVAKDKLELVMRLESDRMANLRLTDAVVNPERNVVLEERRQRIENSPAVELIQESNAVLFMKHPYRNPVIGWKDEVERLSTEDALAFYRAHYAPNNAVLIIAGDVTVDEVRGLAKRYYGSIPARKMPPRVRATEPKPLAARRVTMKSPRVHLPQLSIFWRAPSYRTGGSREPYALEVLAGLLGGGTTSRLYRGLVVDHPIASSVDADYTASQLDFGEFSVTALPKAGGDVDALEAAVRAEIRRIIDDGVTAEELERVKRSMLAGAVYARDGIRAAPNVIGRALATGRTVADVEAWPDRLGAVTAAEVQAAARAIFVDVGSVTSVLLPKSTS